MTLPLSSARSNLPVTELSVLELVSEPALGLRIVAGAAGADRSIRCITSSELPDPTRWLSGGELLLTVGEAIGRRDAVQEAYLERLAAAGLAGIGFGAGVLFEEIPQTLLETADRLGFPLIEVPYETPFVAVNEVAMSRILQSGYRELERTVRVHEALLELVLDDAGLDALVDRVAERTGVSVFVVDDERGTVLAESEGAAALDREERQRIVEARHAVDGDGRIAAFPLGGWREGANQVLVAVAETPIGPGRRMPLAHAATIVALELAKRRAVHETERRLAADLVDDVVSGHVPNRQELDRKLRAYGLAERGESTRLAFILCRPLAGPATTRTLDDCHELIGRSFGRNLATLRDDTICVIATAVSDDAVAAAAAEFAGAAELAVGAARPRLDPDELAIAYDEATYALEAQIANGVSGASTWRDLGSLQLLLALQDPRAVELFCTSVLGDLESATDRGARGALLRREGLFDSHIGKWRRAQTQGRLVATPTAEAGGSPTARERALTVENERLRAELETTKAVLEVAGKVSVLLEKLSESTDTGPRPRR